MINLLPLSEKENLNKKKRVKIVLILATGFLYFLICFILILFSIKFYVKGENALAENFLLEAQSKYEYSKTQEIENNVKRINKDINLINNFYENKNASAIFLKNISEIIPNGICLTNITVNPFVKPKKIDTKKVEEKEYNFKISLVGVADLRENLFNFKQILEKQDGFIEIYIPPSNWTKPSNINFNLTFKIE